MILKLSGRNTLEFLKSLYNTGIPSFDSFHLLDLENVKFVTPFLSIIYKIFVYFQKHIKLPIDENARNYLLYMGDTASIFNGDTRYIPVVHLKEEELKEEVHYKISERLIMIFQNFLSDEIKSSLSYSINELMDNVLFHAQSKHGLWLQLQKYQTLNLIELCICDLGVGISESMRENPDFSSFDSYHRFLLALEIRNTSKPHSNSGEGLSSILEWISLNAEAEGVIFSKRESWIKLKNRKPVTAESEKVLWPGTLIWLAIPGDIEYNLLYTWKKLNLSPDC